MNMMPSTKGRDGRETASHQGEGRFRAIFEHAALGMAVIRPGGKLVEVNQALVKMLGYTPEELSRLSFSEITHPEDLKADSAMARRLVRREVEGYSRENRYIRRDGTVFWGRLTVSLVPGDSEGRFSVVMIEDIDDRKRAEASLSLFRKVMEASHEAVAILSPSGHVLYANSAYGRLFGVDQSWVVGSHYRTYFTPSAQAVVDRALAPALLRGESWEGVLEVEASNGRTFPLWQRAGAVMDENGRVRFFFAFMHDHTAQRNFEDELFNAKEAAVEANISKTRFLAAASHDLRQPMQALSMFVEILGGHCMPPDQVLLVDRIQDSVLALEGLLNSLLDVSKLEAGLVVPEVVEFAIGPVMRRLAGEFEPLCAAKGLALQVVPTEVTVKSDPALLERVLRNLLNNAVRYTQQGRILFGCRRQGQAVSFQVWDTGIGIPRAELRNIFREFHQVGNPERDRRQGLGLGLAIVERLVNLLGHHIQVRSVEGKGSVFSVNVAAAHQALTIAPPRQLQLGLGGTGAAIVVIDDEPDIRESMEMLLRRWGHTVLAGPGAEDILQRLHELPRAPDLILADYRLRNGETGGDAIARVEAHLGQSKRVPAIILTGDTAPERLQQAQALGHGLLHKPVQPSILRQAIDNALSRPAQSKGDRPVNKRKTRARQSRLTTCASST